MNDNSEVTFCDTHGCFFDDAGHTAPKPNILTSSNSQPDESAVFSVLQFGAIIPPLSPWQGIHRFMPGYQYCGTQLISPQKREFSSNVSTSDFDQQSYEIERLMDKDLLYLIGNQSDPVLLFSGGVDSGFIATRLASLGYRNSLLLNYSFGEDDPESQLAEAMAKHLGLRFERITTKRDLCDCLIAPGKVYPQPFGDPSTVPTSDMAYSVVDRLIGKNCLILDGIGADGAFGLTNKIISWGLVRKIPSLVRKAASSCYSSKHWYQNGKFEYLFRILRRSIDMPFLASVIAQNPLAGILYNDLSRNYVDGLLENWVGGWVGEILSRQIVAADLALCCANNFAQKAQPILEQAGHKIAYPFLRTEMVSTAIISISQWKMSEPKAPLKRSLARYVPREMVYRPKSGFMDPQTQVFFEPKFIEYLRVAAEPTSPIAFILDKKHLIDACDLLSSKRKLPYQTLMCLWAIVFTDRWYRTAL